MTIVFSGVSTGSAGGVQQTYALTHTAYLEGQLSDIRDNTIGTYVNETGSVLAFGNAVVFNSGGTGAQSAKTVAGTDLPLAGVNVLTYVDETALDSANRPGVKDDQVMNVVNEGAVVVYVHGTVTPATAVRVVHTTSGVRTAGRFSAANVSGVTALVSNARYLSSVTGSGLAILELNGPSLSLTADTTTA